LLNFIENRNIDAKDLNIQNIEPKSSKFASKSLQTLKIKTLLNKNKNQTNCRWHETLPVPETKRAFV